jgi:hypothetical protein
MLACVAGVGLQTLTFPNKDKSTWVRAELSSGIRNRECDLIQLAGSPIATGEPGK